MTQQLVLTARSTPHRETKPGTYTCIRCGIQRSKTKTSIHICHDCRDDAINLGWIDPPANYTCQKCGRTVQGTHRDMCGNCAWNTRNKATP